MEKFIDVKYTQWTRYYFEQEADLSRIIDELKKTDDIRDVWYDEFKMACVEELVDTAEYITPQENNAATIEVFEGEDMIWNNYNGREIN